MREASAFLVYVPDDVKIVGASMRPPPPAAAQAGFAEVPYVFRKYPFVPAASLAQSVPL